MSARNTNMLPSSSYYVFVFALIFVGLPTHHGFARQDKTKPKLDLKGESFMLDLKTKDEAGIMHESEEIHSAWQQRSKIHFGSYGASLQKLSDKLAKRKSITFFSDKERVYKVDWEELSCSEAARGYVDLLFGYKGLLTPERTHLIGGARLLSFVESNLDKFEFVATTDDVISFKAELNYGITMTVMYNDELTANLPNGIPRMIIIKAPPNITTNYEFTRFQLIKEVGVQSTLSWADSASHYRDISLDKLSLDPMVGCSFAIDAKQEEDPRLAKRGPFRFSFGVRPHEAVEATNPVEMTVVYDSLLANLRVGQIQEKMRVDSITDFKVNRIYHITRKSSNQDSLFESIFKPGSDYSCVVSKLRDSDSYNSSNLNPFTLGKMLLGTNRLTYLGLARVRGIDARVYESHDCELPVWLEQPTVYEVSTPSKKGERDKTSLERRDELNMLKEQGLVLTNVFYFSNTHPTGDEILDEKLLFIEVFLRDARDKQEIRRQSFHIYDFVWDLPITNPAGGRYEDSFSLENYCLALEEEDHDYASIDFVLEGKVDLYKVAWLQKRHKRNLALLYMAQSRLSINPISMLYNIESRLAVGAKVPGQESLHSVSLAVTVKGAERTKSLTRLVFFGRGYINKYFADTYWKKTFHNCYMLAAHRKAETIFAYNARESKCYLLKHDSLVAKPKFCTLTKNKLAEEVYIVLHSNGYTGSHSRLESARKILAHKSDMQLLDPAKLDEIENTMNTSTELAIKSSYVSQLDDEVSYELDELHLSGTNKYSGFGLVPADGQNKLVEPKQTDDHGNYTGNMSFERCQTACLVDLECRSYSICLNNGKMRCVLSKVSFRTPSMALQLMELTDKTAKFGKVFPITVDTAEQDYLNARANGESPIESIQVMKHLGCELHNKLYMDLFENNNDFLNVLFRGILTPVAHREHCAELCFRKTLSFLRNPVNRSPLNGTAASLTEYGNGQICKSLKYVPRQFVDQIVENAAKNDTKIAIQIDSSIQQDMVNGYCDLKNEFAADNEHMRQDTVGMSIKFVSHDFDFSVLFEKHHGISLAESIISEEQRRSIYKVLSRLDPATTHIDINPNENIGSTNGVIRVEHCAVSCFLFGSLVAYPECRSVDHIVVTSPNKMARKICAFNSLSLKSAIAAGRTDLIRVGADKQERIYADLHDTVKVTHLEPREGLAAQCLDDIYQVQLAKQLRLATSSSSLVHIGGFSIFLAVIFLSSLGIVCGLSLGARLLGGVRMERKEKLIESQIEIDELPKADVNTFRQL